MNLPECRLPKTHKEIVRIMVFSISCLKDGQATSNTKARAPLPGFSRVIWDEWGKKGVRMDTKALKKQMGAAIAMVLVAAVALGSATFAWFCDEQQRQGDDEQHQRSVERCLHDDCERHHWRKRR